MRRCRKGKLVLRYGQREVPGAEDVPLKEFVKLIAIEDGTETETA